MRYDRAGKNLHRHPSDMSAASPSRDMPSSEVTLSLLPVVVSVAGSWMVARWTVRAERASSVHAAAVDTGCSAHSLACGRCYTSRACAA